MHSVTVLDDIADRVRIPGGAAEGGGTAELLAHDDGGEDGGARDVGGRVGEGEEHALVAVEAAGAHDIAVVGGGGCGLWVVVEGLGWCWSAGRADGSDAHMDRDSTTHTFIRECTTHAPVNCRHYPVLTIPPGPIKLFHHHTGNGGVRGPGPVELAGLQAPVPYSVGLLSVLG